MNTQKKKNLLKGILIFLIGIILGSAISIRKQQTFIKYYREQNEQEYTKFEVIKQLLQSEYVEPEKLTENKEKMSEKAIAGFIDGLEDPYTVYLTSKENTELTNILKEESGIVGIGAVVEKKDNYIQIAEIIKN
jgi:carboxyl-terminal processing protease